MKEIYIPGQRWYSESEPELGLGCIVSADARRVQVHFASRDLSRDYASDSAPLHRVRYKAGDMVTSQTGVKFKIDQVEELDGLLIYRNATHTLPESELGETMDFGSPEERLALGNVDEKFLFNLRFLALSKHCWLESLGIRGLLGARISLLPHQLYIASEVAGRYHTRIMLGDEVGLGKTIEAGLILHRQILTGMCTRVLILLPESLTHQWFLELWRRFNLIFSLFDEERCLAIAAGQKGENPFLDSSLVICSLEFLTTNPQRLPQLLAAEWDMMVVDEAHHLTWEPEKPSLEYAVVDQLAQVIPGVLLLSGTPEQLGESGHFARLRLLDPHRFHNLDQFHEEQRRYASVAGVIKKLLEQEPLAEQELNLISAIYRFDPEKLKKQLKASVSGDVTQRRELIATLVDHHGTGRLFYRNQRSSIRGFPKRIVKLYPLPLGDICAGMYGQNIPVPAYIAQPEFRVAGHQWQEWWKHDPRVPAVLDLLKAHPGEKMLLICARRETVQALQSAIEYHANIPLAIFHEDLPLIVRDRNAAFFAEPNGARLLICSEIGSEGRNFQFCHHLLLFDVPLNPELLEQRIGRLDRIGQKDDVQIHVVYLERAMEEVLVKWYHEGLDAFHAPLQGASKLYDQFGNRVCELAGMWFANPDLDQLEQLIHDTKQAKKITARLLTAGRDRLLQWHSYQPHIGAALVEEIEYVQSRSELESFMEGLCLHLGIRVEDHDHNSLFLQPGDHYHGLPGLPDEGLPVTFSRQRALAREDLTFLTWEHPMVIGAIDQILGSWSGRVSYGVWEDHSARTVLLETIFLLHCQAPKSLRCERFLPPTPLRVIIDHEVRDLTEQVSHEFLQTVLKDDPRPALLQKPEATRQLLPSMIKQCRLLADQRKVSICGPALAKMKATLEPEIIRLSALLAADAPVRKDEIDHLKEEYRLLEYHLKDAMIRLDSLRVIWRGAQV